jgi:hypothetical protein
LIEDAISFLRNFAAKPTAPTQPTSTLTAAVASTPVVVAAPAKEKPAKVKEEKPPKPEKVKEEKPPKPEKVKEEKPPKPEKVKEEKPSKAATATAAALPKAQESDAPETILIVSCMAFIIFLRLTLATRSGCTK